MARFKYKNKTDTEQILMGVGFVPPHGEIETDEEVNNPNFQLLEGEVRLGIEPKTTRPKRTTKKS